MSLSGKKAQHYKKMIKQCIYLLYYNMLSLAYSVIYPP